MADQQGQDMFGGERNEDIIYPWGDLQRPSTIDDQQTFLKNSQNQVQACEDLKPHGNCSWVDCADQVHFI